MPQQTIRIAIHELPLRSQALSAREISEIFGGCVQPGPSGPATCNPDCPDCCPPYECIYKGTPPHASYYCASG